jgi:hypothetical protein
MYISQHTCPIITKFRGHVHMNVLYNMYKFGGLIHSFSKFSIKSHILTKIEYESETWFHCNFSYKKYLYRHTYNEKH